MNNRFVWEGEICCNNPDMHRWKAKPFMGAVGWYSSHQGGLVWLSGVVIWELRLIAHTHKD